MIELGDVLAGQLCQLKLTIENGSGEETQELEEQVLLLRGQFVPSSLPSSSFDLSCRQTLLPVGLHPLVGGLEAAVGAWRQLLLAELIPLLLGHIVVDGASDGSSTSISVVGDVLHKVTVLAQVAAVVGLSVALELFFGIAVLNVLMRSHCGGKKRGDGREDDNSKKTTARHLHKDERKKDWKESCARGGGSSI